MNGRRGLLLALALAALPVAAHEIEGNRATLVLRDGRHLSLTLQIDLVPALQRALGSTQAPAEFVAVHAALPPAQLEPVLRQARRRIEAATQLTTGDGQPLPLTRWQWPSAAQTQALLQRATMQALVGGGDAHDGIVEVRAESVAARGLGVVRLRLPEALQPVLVVWYRPLQAWSRAGSPPLQADFR